MDKKRAAKEQNKEVENTVGSDSEEQQENTKPENREQRYRNDTKKIAHMRLPGPH